MRVRVYNDNKYVYREKFKGEQVVIEPGNYVMMEEDDAELFLGSFSPIVLTGAGTPDPKFFKQLRIDKQSAPVVAEHSASSLVCAKCKYSATSATDLAEHALLAHERDLLNADEVKKSLKR